jgi:hypothetical protein
MIRRIGDSGGRFYKRFSGVCPGPAPGFAAGSADMTLERIYRLLYKGKRRCPADTWRQIYNFVREGYTTYGI